MVVELNIVEVNEIANLPVDVHIPSVFVSFRAEVRSLRSMGKDVIGDH